LQINKYENQRLKIKYESIHKFLNKHYYEKRTRLQFGILVVCTHYFNRYYSFVTFLINSCLKDFLNNTKESFTRLNFWEKSRRTAPQPFIPKGNNPQKQMPLKSPDFR